MIAVGVVVVVGVGLTGPALATPDDATATPTPKPSASTSGSTSGSAGRVKGWAKVMKHPARKVKGSAKATPKATPKGTPKTTPSASRSRAAVPGVESTPDPDNSASAPPEQPVITGVVEGDGQLTVTWDPPAGDPPTSYTVWVGGEVPDAGCDEISADTHTCTVDTGLENETSYAVEVAANNTGGETAYSQAWWATPRNTQVTVPGAPTLHDIEVDGNKLTLTWDAPADDGGLATLGYRIDAMRAGDDQAVPCEQPQGRASTTCTIVGVADVGYKATVTAWNSEGEGPASGEKTATASSSRPGPPAVTAELAGNTVTVTATADDNGGVAIDGYEVAVTNVGTGDVVACAGTKTSEEPILYTAGTCAFEGVQGSSYAVMVRAHNSVGYSDQTTVTRTMAPAAPTASVAVDGRTVTVSWTPHGTGGAAIQGYLVTVHVEGQQGTVPCTGERGQGEWSTLYTGGSCTFTGVPGTAYTASVKARNSVGTSDIAGTDTATVPALAAPHDVVAAPGDTTATVTWTAITPATGITGYTVTYTREGGQAQSAQVPGAATHSHELTGLENGATYSVTVKAVLDEGTVQDSEPVTVTPSAPATIPDSVPQPDDALSAPAGATTPEPGETITVSGTGFAPNSRVDLVIYSSPQSLGTATTEEDGSFSKAVVIPSNLSGSHTVTSFGVDSDGDPRILALGITLAAVTQADADDDSADADGADSAGGLAVTGAPTVTLLLTGVLLVAAGVSTRMAGRRRR
jgi:titin